MLLVSIAFFFQTVKAQTFSSRANDDLLSVYLGVLNQPFGYQAIGVKIDTNAGYHFSTIIRNFNFEGEVIDTKNYYFPNKTYNPNGDINTRLNDSIVVCAVIDIEAGNDTLYSTILWLTNEGDTIQSRRFYSPYYIEGIAQTSHIRPTSIISSPDGQSIYFVSQIIHSSSQNNFMIKKITAQGDEVWTYVNPLNIWYSYCNSIEYLNGQPWFVSIASGNQGHFNKLIRLNDESGEVDFQIEHQGEDYPIGGGNDVVLDETGIVIATTNNNNGLLPHLFKMNLEGEYDWYVTPEGLPAPFQYNDHLAQSPDGGYVSCSVKYEEQINPNDPDDPAATNTSEKIWLWKVDSNGNFLWQRFYEFLSFDSGYFYLDNTAKDLKATPDGGYIMAGESSASCLEWPCLAGDPFTQQGWLLKVDACGCLVPGCDPNCIVSVEEKQVANENKYFRFGPNPVGDLLNLYIPPLPFSIKELTFSLVDMNSRKIKDFQFQYDNTTYMMDAQSLAAGNYILSITKDGQVLQSERLIKK
jgi:hypothetical protein